jgi:hypothetical protein
MRSCEAELVIKDDSRKVLEKGGKVMAVMDEFKEEREAMKHGTIKQKMSYYWLYYKWYVIVIAAVTVFIISFLYNILTRKEDAFSAAFINAWAEEGVAEEYLQTFAQDMGIDLNKYQINLDSYLYLTQDSLDQTSMATVQKVMAYIASNSLDVLAADETTFLSYAYSGALADLRTLLTPAQMERYEPYFYYMDGKVQEKKEAMEENMDSSETLIYPDPTNPEIMEDPVPIAVFINNSPALKEAYLFSEENVPMGIVVNTRRQQMAVDFLDYVMQDAP